MAVDLWSASASLSRCSDYCADCCGASGSAGSRKLHAQADQRFSHSLLKMRIAEQFSLWQVSEKTQSMEDCRLPGLRITGIESAYDSTSKIPVSQYLSLPMHREGKEKRRAALKPALSANLSSMPANNPLHDSQTQSTPLKFLL